MSSDGHLGGEEIPAGVTIALTADDGFDWHDHDHHQLAWASSGVLIMAVGRATWVLPRSRALWIPAGTRHSVATAGATVMLSLYIDPARCPISWPSATLVDASDLVGHLGAHLVSPDLEPGERERAESVLWDLLEPVDVTALAISMPTDDRARRVADSLLTDVSDRRTLTEWGHEVGASTRTLARLFAAETGMGFERWRTQARISAALPLLADGATVAAVGSEVGYATPSAFVAAFRREIGSTPGEYFRLRRTRRRLWLLRPWRRCTIFQLNLARQSCPDDARSVGGTSDWLAARMARCPDLTGTVSRRAT